MESSLCGTTSTASSGIFRFNFECQELLNIKELLNSLYNIVSTDLKRCNQIELLIIFDKGGLKLPNLMYFEKCTRTLSEIYSKLQILLQK